MPLINLKKKYVLGAAKAAAALILLVATFSPLQVSISSQGQGVLAPSIAHAADSSNKTPGQTAGICDDASTCISNIIYVFTVGIMSVFAYIGSYVFGLAVQLTLTSTAYSQEFLTTGWVAVRDIANMAFIFILIYIAFTIILEAETSGTMKMLAGVVVMALLVNFSFFITRVVIDSGNILAIQFYNALPITHTLGETVTDSTATSAAAVTSLLPGSSANRNVKDLTWNIMQVVQIQNILNQDGFKKFSADHTGFTGFLVVLITLSLVYIAVGAMFAILAFAFLSVGFKFLMRVVVLWFVIISAPLAFAARALGGKNKKSLNLYNRWQDLLIKFSFYPAIFLFIFLITNYFMVQMASASGGAGGLIGGIFKDLNTSTTGTGFLALLGSAIANVAIRLGFIVIMLYYAMKVADYIVEEGSGAAKGFTSKLTNMTAGVAGWTARNTVGRGANALSRSRAVQDLAANSFAGTALKGGLQRIATSSLDVRGVAGLRTLAGKSGANLIAPTKNAQGGFVGQINRRAAAIKKRAGELKPDEVDVQKAQEAFEKEYDAKNGKGAYAARVGEKKTLSDIESRSAGAENRAKENEDLAKRLETTPGMQSLEGEAMIKGYQEQARKAREEKGKLDIQAAQEKKAIEALQKVAKERTDRTGKERVAALATRLGTRNLQNLYMPSRGSIKGAAQILTGKTTHEKTKDLLKEIEAEHGEHEEGHEEGGHDGDKPHGGGGGHTPPPKGGGGKPAEGGTGTHAAAKPVDHGHGGNHDAGHHASLENVEVSLSKETIAHLAQKLGGRIAGVAEKQQKNTAADLRAVIHESGLAPQTQIENKPSAPANTSQAAPQKTGSAAHIEVHTPAENDNQTPSQQSGEAA